jgi:methylase of polypeptide subunit release factors
VVARPDRRGARDLRDVFGWSLPFAEGDVEPEIVGLMREGAMLETADDGRFRSTVRVSTLVRRLFLHSAYPTEGEDAVFFGPDTYRFADFILAELPDKVRGTIVDIGSGSGAGGILAAGAEAKARVVLSDVNPAALRLARINAAHAGVTVETVEGEGLSAIEGPLEVVLANPPYMIDPEERAYREGGGMHGARLSLDWTREAAERLQPGGRLLMYTGSAIVDGRDAFREAATAALEAAGCDWTYREIDPDVFGEELERPEYADVERIAVVGLVAVKRA